MIKTLTTASVTICTTRYEITREYLPPVTVQVTTSNGRLTAVDWAPSTTLACKHIWEINNEIVSILKQNRLIKE